MKVLIALLLVSCCARGGWILTPNSPVSPIGDTSYNGAPTVTSIGPSEDVVLVAAYERSNSSSLRGAADQTIALASSVTNGTTWIQLVSPVALKGPLWSPSLYFDPSTQSLFLYFTAAAELEKSGTLFVTSTSDIDTFVNWSHPVEVLAAEGRVSGPVVLTTVEEGQLPVWAFPVENPTVGTVIVKCSRTSTLFEASPVVLSVNYTNAMLALTPTGFVMLARPSAQASENPRTLVVVSSNAADAMQGWDEPMPTAFPNPMNRDFSIARGFGLSPVALLAIFADAASPTMLSVYKVDLTMPMYLPVDGSITFTLFDPNATSVVMSPIAYPLSPFLVEKEITVFSLMFAVYSSVACDIIGFDMSSVPAQQQQPGPPTSHTLAIVVTFGTISVVVVILIIVWLKGFLRKGSAEETALLLPS